VHPQTEQESIFRTFLLDGLDLKIYLVVLDRLLRATTKKRSSTFFGEKVHPRQNPVYAYRGSLDKMRGLKTASFRVFLRQLAP